MSLLTALKVSPKHQPGTDARADDRHGALRALGALAFVFGTLSCTVDDRNLTTPAVHDAGASADAAHDASRVVDGSPANDASTTANALLADAQVASDGQNATADEAAPVDGSQPRCGDGHTDPGEECDDGNPIDGDGCESSCQFSCAVDDASRGCQSGDPCRPDGTCDPVKHTCTTATPRADGSTCTTPGGGTVCRAGSCTVPGCGNGQVGTGEECDDGNIINGDGCQNDCRYTCDSADPSRNCALGNACQTSTCTAAHKCSAPVPLAEGTSCGTDVSAAYCRAGTCVRAVCGNGQLETAQGEECDDGNQIDGDGCEKNCRYSCVSSDSARNCKPADPCDSASTCSDTTHRCSARTKLAEGASCGPASPISVCRNGLCAATNCGNHLVEPGEECDDANAVKGDGCEPNCKWTCLTSDATRNCSSSNPCDGASTCNDQHLCTARTPLAEGTSCGTATAPAYCRSGACSPARCGNGFVEPGESCEDRNTVSGDGCENNCAWSCPQGGTRACAGAQGNCAKGTQTCTNGKWGNCSIAAKPSNVTNPDSCTILGDDADCDGKANENCPCVDGDPDRACGHATVGVCHQGKQKCQGGQWLTCTGNIEPGARNCTSSADNDCNGTADNAETTFCACAVGTTRPCQTHPGKDGVGICKAGSQTCVASTDKTTSAWSATCVGWVAPSTELCNDDGKDENCDNHINEGCGCTNGEVVSCNCGGTKTCRGGQFDACSTIAMEIPRYRDSDGDGYGDPNFVMTSCSRPLGYVDRAGDCCDTDSLAFPGSTSWRDRLENGACSFDLNCDGKDTPMVVGAPTCTTAIQCGFDSTGACTQIGGCGGPCNGVCGGAQTNGCGKPWGVSYGGCTAAGTTCTSYGGGTDKGLMPCQ